MIINIGTDIVDVNRIQANLERLGDRFAEKILSANEYQEYLKIAKQAHFVAKRFAVKEALLKALGTGLRDGFSLDHIEVIHDKHGKPSIRCYGAVANYLEVLKVSRTHLTIADEKDY